MTFDEYQQQAKGTAVYPIAMAIAYPALGLAGEAGEVCNKVKKVFRDYGGSLSASGLKGQLMDELGDCFWYLSALATDIGVALDDVAQMNLKKLAARKTAGTLHGSGDQR